MRHQRVQLVLTFCKLSQFQFGSLQCLLSQIGYRFADPSSLKSLCVWPFQTIVRFCEAYYHFYLLLLILILYILLYICEAYYHFYLLLLILILYILLYILPLYYYTTIPITSHKTYNSY